jgi:hypothetical protein
MDMVAAAMYKYFPAPSVDDVPSFAHYCNRPDQLKNISSACDELLPEGLVDKLNRTGRVPAANDVKYMFLTKSGPGPQKQPLEECLLSPATGLPVPPSAKHKRLVIGAPMGDTKRQKMSN